MRQPFYCNMQQNFVTNASGFLLKNLPVLLQNAKVSTSCDDFITK